MNQPASQPAKIQCSSQWALSSRPSSESSRERAICSSVIAAPTRARALTQVGRGVARPCQKYWRRGEKMLPQTHLTEAKQNKRQPAARSPSLAFISNAMGHNSRIGSRKRPVPRPPPLAPGFRLYDITRQLRRARSIQVRAVSGGGGSMIMIYRLICERARAHGVRGSGGERRGARSGGDGARDEVR